MGNCNQWHRIFWSIICLALVHPLWAQELKLDPLARLLSYPDKIEVPCPNQTKKTGVLLAFGQSNSANHGEKKFITKYPKQVFNYFNGKCYVAASPLLGASATGGEFITPLADKLIEYGDYNNIIIIATGIGATTVQRWAKGGDLNPLLLAVLANVKPKYQITEIVWHQGESDLGEHTTAKDYTNRFYSLLQSIRETLNSKPPIYYAVASKCGPGWQAKNPVHEAQLQLANQPLNIYLGANTDELILDSDRVDLCHFNEQGQLKAAQSYAKAIHEQKQGQGQK